MREQVTDILRLIALLTELAKSAIDAATSENPSRVQDVLPETLEMSIARLTNELEAARNLATRA